VGRNLFVGTSMSGVRTDVTVGGIRSRGWAALSIIPALQWCNQRSCRGGYGGMVWAEHGHCNMSVGTDVTVGVAQDSETGR
jgi:hypothetical protein